MSPLEITEKIIAKAKELGADLAGIASVEALRQSPSSRIFKKIGMEHGAVGAREFGKVTEIAWPDNMHSVLVIAISHPENRPELDWWQGKGTKGNSMLIAVNKKMREWINADLGFETKPVPYKIGQGGYFLKDAAVLAGLGCVGKNNMLVSSEYGPRIRLRALLLAEELPPTGPIEFDPCRGCAEYCRQACPQGAFNDQVYDADELGQKILPGRTGCYSRKTCGKQMARDHEDAGPNVEGTDRPEVTKFCRRCELACPVGKAVKRKVA